MNGPQIARIAPLVVAALLLTGCSGGGGTPATGSAPTASSSPASSPPAVSAGSVSKEGVCGLVPIATVNSTLGRSYASSKEVSIDQVIAGAAYCDYTPASGSGEFEIQVVPGDPADATQTLNDAAGGVLMPITGVGDSAMYASSFPELVVVYGDTTIAVGQSTSAAGASEITLDQLKKLADAVHSAK
ncbi:MAG: hypothetical protein ABJA94_04480 [Rhodoglobus sp.]